LTGDRGWSSGKGEKGKNKGKRPDLEKDAERRAKVSFSSHVCPPTEAPHAAWDGGALAWRHDGFQRERSERKK
jgi:hypothetical protein